MNSRQLILVLAGASVAVTGALVLFRDTDPSVVVASALRPKSAAQDKGDTLDSRGPAPMKLGGVKPPGSKGEEADKKGARGDRARTELDNYRQAHRPQLGGTRPGHPGRGDDVESAGADAALPSELADASRLAETDATSGARGAVARQGAVDDWSGVDADVVDPENARQPEEGEVLSLFEGDPALAQAEASIAKDVSLEEDGARFSLDSEYAVPMAGKLSGEAGSLSFWVRPEGDTTDVDNASLVQLRSANEWANRLQVWKDGGNVRLVFSDGNGQESGATYGSDSWAGDEWRLVTVTWGDRLNALYVNGQLAGTAQFEGGFKILPDTLLHVGSNYRDDPRSLTGTVSRFRVYNRPLSPDEVANLPSQYPE